LRLKRTGNTFAGFAGYDGQTWTQLGKQQHFNVESMSISDSQSAATIPTSRPTTQFLDAGDVTNAVVGTVVIRMN